MGRPAFEITDDVCNKAEQYAAEGLTQEQIATALGMGERTLYEKVKKFPQFAQAIKRGQAKGIQEVANALFQNAMKGNVTAQIFFLKNRSPETWKDRNIPDDSEQPKASKVNVTVIDGRKSASDQTTG